MSKMKILALTEIRCSIIIKALRKDQKDHLADAIEEMMKSDNLTYVGLKPEDWLTVISGLKLVSELLELAKLVMLPDPDWDKISETIRESLD